MSPTVPAGHSDWFGRVAGAVMAERARSAMSCCQVGRRSIRAAQAGVDSTGVRTDAAGGKTPLQDVGLKIDRRCCCRNSRPSIWAVCLVCPELNTAMRLL